MDAIRDSCEELLAKMCSTMFAPPFAVEKQILALCLLSSASIQFRATFFKKSKHYKHLVAVRRLTPKENSIIFSVILS